MIRPRTVSAPELCILQIFFGTGIDATEAFEDVGHSDEARALLPDMLVGDFDASSGVRTNYPSAIFRSMMIIILVPDRISNYTIAKRSPRAAL